MGLARYNQMSSKVTDEWLVQVLAPLPSKKNLRCSSHDKSCGPQRRFGRPGSNLILSVFGSYLVSISAKNERRKKNKNQLFWALNFVYLPIRHCS
jgi:hypothetical protein